MSAIFMIRWRFFSNFFDKTAFILSNKHYIYNSSIFCFKYINDFEPSAVISGDGENRCYWKPCCEAGLKILSVPDRIFSAPGQGRWHF